MALPYNRLFPLKGMPVVQRNEPVAPAPTPTRPTYRGGWVGAQHNRLNMDWNSMLESADLETRRDGLALRGRSRDLCKNNPYAQRFLQLLAVNVIGNEGISLQCRVRTPTDELDSRTNRAIQDGFKLWGKSVTVDGRLSWLEVQHLLITTVAQDGEAFVRLYRNANNRYRLALQILDADLLDVNFNRPPDKNGIEIRQSIELDVFNAPVAFWFFTRHPSELGPSTKRIRVPADEIIHLMRSHRSGQYRGVPWLAPVMQSIKILGEVMAGELIAAKTSAYKMGFITTAQDDATPYLMDDQPQETMSAAPGMITRLNPGEEFNGWNPDHPSTAFDSFTRTILRSIATGLGVSYSALTNDFSTENFSAARMAGQHERDHYRTLQAWLIRTLHERVFTEWLTSAINANALPLGSDNVDDYLAYEFKGRAFSALDPVKEANAYKLLLDLGLTSRARIHAEQGTDINEIFADLDHEQQLASEYGIDISGTKTTPPTPTQPAPDEPLEDPTKAPLGEDSTDATPLEEQNG